VVSVTPRPHFTPGKNPVPIVQEAGWAPGPVWTGGKSRARKYKVIITAINIHAPLPGGKWWITSFISSNLIHNSYINSYINLELIKELYYDARPNKSQDWWITFVKILDSSVSLVCSLQGREIWFRLPF